MEAITNNSCNSKNKIICIYCLINIYFIVTIGRRWLVQSYSLKGRRSGCSKVDTVGTGDKYFSCVFSERYNQEDSVS